MVVFKNQLEGLRFKEKARSAHGKSDDSLLEEV
jgi:hypothetical protein